MHQKVIFRTENFWMILFGPSMVSGSLPADVIVWTVQEDSITRFGEPLSKERKAQHRRRRREDEGGGTQDREHKRAWRRSVILTLAPNTAIDDRLSASLLPPDRILVYRMENGQILSIKGAVRSEEGARWRFRVFQGRAAVLSLYSYDRCDALEMRPRMLNGIQDIENGMVIIVWNASCPEETTVRHFFVLPSIPAATPSNHKT